MITQAPKYNIKKTGFTFVEVMIAIILMSISFFPIMQLFTDSMTMISTSSEMTTSHNLAREGIEMIRNLNLPTTVLNNYGEVYYPATNEKPLQLNKNGWRILTKVYKDSSPLKVEVTVLKYPGKQPTLKITTLFEDLF